MADNATEETRFALLVSLACHDLRTPLATVLGFAHTLGRQGELEEPAARYVEMIAAAAGQLGELVDELSLGARIEAGRYDPVRREVDTLELARVAAEELGEERVAVEGEGAVLELDDEATKRSVAALAQCALRHGGLEQVRLEVRGSELVLSPVTPSSAPRAARSSSTERRSRFASDERTGQRRRLRGDRAREARARAVRLLRGRRRR
jgi:signal transduction histidine kinase